MKMPEEEREPIYQYDPEDDYGPHFDEGYDDPDGTWGDETGE